MNTENKSELRALWLHQEDAIKAVAESWREHRRVFWVGPTGCGKTAMEVRIAENATSEGKRTLILTHRQEILNHFVRSLAHDGLDLSRVGIIWRQDARENREAPVQVASVQTIVRRERPEADIVLIDEAHHAVAASYQTILADYPNALVAGFSAVGCRLDGKPLGAGAKGYFDTMIVGPTAEALIRDGYIARPRVFSAAHGSQTIDVRGLSVTKSGDFSPVELARRADKTEIVGDIAEHWTRLAQGRRTIVFAAGLTHAGRLTDIFATLVGRERVALLTADTPAVERDSIRERLTTGALLVVVNYDIVAEGFDCPAVSCVVMARPTASLTVYLQQAGRGMRPFRERSPEGVMLDIAPMVIDHASNWRRFGLPEKTQKWSLNGNISRRQREREAEAKECPNCAHVVSASATRCGECGYLWPETSPDEVKGTLEEMNAASEEEIQAYREMMTARAERAGLKNPAAFARKIANMNFGLKEASE